MLRPLPAVLIGAFFTVLVWAEGFAPVEPGKIIEFPQDHQLHPDFKDEWWYLTANLRDSHGKHYGVQFTLFATAEFVHGKKQRIFFAHAALSSEEDFFYAERYARADMRHAGIEPSPFRAYMDHWQLAGEKDAPLPGLLRVDEADFAYRLTLSDAQYFLQGDQGFSIKNASGSLASYYYNAPFIDIRGEIRLGNERISVSGRGWLDREWSSDLMSADQLGWDWMSLRLDDNTALKLFFARSVDEEFFSANLMYADGNSESLRTAQVDMRVLEHETFMGVDYPIVWSIKIPGKEIDIIVRPINRHQFLYTRVPYWEGAVTTTGTHSGEGYMELFGERSQQ